MSAGSDIIVFHWPTIGPDGIRAAYIEADDQVRLLAGPSAWSFPAKGWNLTDLSLMSRALCMTLRDADVRILRERVLVSAPTPVTSTMVIHEPLRERHLTPLIESGDMTSVDVLRALAWAAANPA